MTKADNAPSATILVVDDTEANRSLAKASLEDEGYRVVLAEGGSEGIAAFEAERPDCVLLDVRMPGMDGFATCERIRALPGGGETPILFLTALRDVETFDRALHAGGDDFLTKPIRPSELVVRVQTALKLRRMSVELREHHDLLRHQRNDLLRLQLQKERLMAFVVHDLKNPLSTMHLHAQCLLQSGGLSDGDRKSVASIYSAARELNRMVLNLLDMSKADEGKLSPERSDVDLSSLIRDILAELDVSARRSKVALRSSLWVERTNIDHDLFRRTLTNLIENAIRYAPRETTVSVTSKRGPSCTEVSVSDAGRGVPEAMRERVFDAFVQVEASGGAPGSRGLGLAFCKLAVEAHGGRIWIEDGAPGAVFCISVPDVV